MEIESETRASDAFRFHGMSQEEIWFFRYGFLSEIGSKLGPSG